MRNEDRPNPYHEQTLTALYDAAMKRAGELMGSSKPVGRRDTAHLLIVLAHKVDSKGVCMGSPAHAVQRQGAVPSVAFGRALEEQQSATRWRLFQQLLDTVGDVPHGPLRGRLLSLANESDAGFRAAALELDEIWQARLAEKAR